jgi:hypothetical protein
MTPVVDPIVATPVAPLVQVPPDIELDKVLLVPVHRAVVPLIVGVGFTVTVTVVVAVAVPSEIRIVNASVPEYPDVGV